LPQLGRAKIKTDRPANVTRLQWLAGSNRIAARPSVDFTTIPLPTHPVAGLKTHHQLPSSIALYPTVRIGDFEVVDTK